MRWAVVLTATAARHSPLGQVRHAPSHEGPAARRGDERPRLPRGAERASSRRLRARSRPRG